MIEIKITGLDKVMNGFSNVEKEWPIVRKAVLKAAGRFFVNEAQRNVHRVSGNLYRSISIDSQTPNSITVSAKMPYAAIENSRVGRKTPTVGTIGPYGPHNYWTLATQSLQQNFASRIKVNLDSLLHKLGF